MTDDIRQVYYYMLSEKEIYKAIDDKLLLKYAKTYMRLFVLNKARVSRVRPPSSWFAAYSKDRDKSSATQLVLVLRTL